MSIHSLGTYKHGFLSLRPCTLILQGREAITAGAEVADDRSLELCGLDLPSAPWKRGAGVGDGFKRDTWAKHLFQMASHISAARGIIDLTCWPVHLRQPADERKTRGRLEELAWETEEWHGERERTHKWICPSPCTGATLYNNSQCGLQWKHLLSTASFTALSQSNRCALTQRLMQLLLLLLLLLCVFSHV